MSTKRLKRIVLDEKHKAYIREHSDISPDEDYEMNLYASDRRKLWAKAGGKCSKCNLYLFPEEISETNIGQECHISSHKKYFPSKEFSRYTPNLKKEERDKKYENAILLCGNCHIIIDNPKNIQFTNKELQRIKREHEIEIKNKVNGDIEILNQEVLFEHIRIRKQLKGFIHKHNKKLIESIFKDWYGERKTLVLKKQQQYTVEHLRTGYPNIWKSYFEEYTSIENQISDDEKIIKNYIKTKLNNGDNSYLKLEDVIGHLYFIQDINKNNKIVLIPDRWTKKICDLLDDFLVKGQVQDNHIIEHSNEIIKLILNDSFLTEIFKKINPNEKVLSQKNIEFIRCLDGIIHDFEEGHIELNGYCKLCKKWHDELKIIGADLHSELK